MDDAFQPQPLSDLSTNTVPDSLWHSSDLQLGAGVVIIQPETGLVVVLSEKYSIRVPKSKSRSTLQSDPSSGAAHTRIGKKKRRIEESDDDEDYLVLEKETWFLPKGRKDVGETLETAALREGYEEVRERLL